VQARTAYITTSHPILTRTAARVIGDDSNRRESVTLHTVQIRPQRTVLRPAAPHFDMYGASSLGRHDAIQYCHQAVTDSTTVLMVVGMR
jgi:hypothetical protein